MDIADEEIVADRVTADLMRCKIRKRLLRISATRVLVKPKGRPGMPVALAEILLPAEYSDILAVLPTYNKTICDLLEERYGVHALRIEQIVEPCTVTAAEARKLGVALGTLGLRFHRTYVNPKGVVFEHATSLQAGSWRKYR